MMALTAPERKRKFMISESDWSTKGTEPQTENETKSESTEIKEEKQSRIIKPITLRLDQSDHEAIKILAMYSDSKGNITAYINDLIKNDIKQNKAKLEKFKELMNE